MFKEKSRVSFSPYSVDETKKNIKIAVSASTDDGSKSEKMAQKMAGYFSDVYKNEVYGVVDLEKNQSEIEAIKMAQEGLNEFFNDLKLRGMQFDLSEIHILSEQEFDEKINLIDQKKSGGKYSFGHIYCIRDEFINFLHKLVHELAHTFSFYYLSVDSSLDETHINMRQSGLSYSKNNDNHLFNGLNEAVTELITTEVLKKIVKNNNFKSKEKDELINTIDYYPQVLVLKELVDEISGEDDDFKEELMKKIYRGSYNGDYAFLKEFEKRHKGSIKILREMGTEDEHALEAVKKLHLKKAQKIIEDFIGEKSQSKLSTYPHKKPLQVSVEMLN